MCPVPAAASATLPTPGDVLDGRYQILSQLGEGGMGVVFEAADVTSGMHVAIKAIRPQYLTEHHALLRFAREALAMGQLQSVHAVRVHAVSHTPAGVPYLVMDLLAGRDLGAELTERGPLPVHEACHWVACAAAVMAEAHAAGIVHRDLKPSNLFLARDGRRAPVLKVLDFGISKVTRAAGGELTQMTAATALLGTPLFMAPEQVRSGTDVDGRADLWALGVVLFQLLSGTVPFTAPSVSGIFAAIAADRPRALRSLRADVPPAVEAIVERALQKDPGDRYQSADELRLALLPWTRVNAETTGSSWTHIDTRPPRPARSFHPPPAAATAVPPAAPPALRLPDAVTHSTRGRLGARVAVGVLVGTLLGGVTIFAMHRPAPTATSAPRIEDLTADPTMVADAATTATVATTATAVATAVASASSAAPSVAAVAVTTLVADGTLAPTPSAKPPDATPAKKPGERAGGHYDPILDSRR